jgi:hypothetical protein
MEKASFIMELEAAVELDELMVLLVLLVQLELQALLELLEQVLIQ